MKSLAELNKLKNIAIKNMNAKKNDQGYKIIIGMATCGIAAGGKKIMKAFKDDLKIRNVYIPVSITGCVGVCRLEPMADIIDEKGNKTTYIMLTPEKVTKIVQSHIINGQIVSEYTINSANSIF